MFPGVFQSGDFLDLVGPITIDETGTHGSFTQVSAKLGDNTLKLNGTVPLNGAEDTIGSID